MPKTLRAERMVDAGDAGAVCAGGGVAHLRSGATVAWTGGGVAGGGGTRDVDPLVRYREDYAARHGGVGVDERDAVLFYSGRARSPGCAAAVVVLRALRQCGAGHADERAHRISRHGCGDVLVAADFQPVETAAAAASAEWNRAVSFDRGAVAPLGGAG